MEGKREGDSNDGRTEREGERVKRIIYPPHSLKETESLFIYTDDNPQLKHSHVNSNAGKFGLNVTTHK